MDGDSDWEHIHCSFHFKSTVAKKNSIFLFPN